MMGGMCTCARITKKLHCGNFFMNVAMMQPTFMPWQGYFELIARSDIFIFLDNFQFSIQSFHQRNRLFVDTGRVDWYIVPVLKSISYKSSLNETRIHETIPWRKKMWMRIKTNYKKCDYFDEIEDVLHDWLTRPSLSLASLNIEFIKIICKTLNISPEFRYSSKLFSTGVRSQRVAELLRECRGTRYYCAQGAFSYMSQDAVFPVPDIEVVFQDFHPYPYSQKGSPQQFVPYLSILDSIMNIGPKKTADMIRSGTPQWLTWDDMLNRSNSGNIS